MTTQLECIADSKDLNKKTFKVYDNNNKYPKYNIIKCIDKHKCDKILRNKLRKYKLRNGVEDPDVIDVSHLFLSSLKIKSPTKSISFESDDIEDFRPKNYLFKMARRKQKSKLDGPEMVKMKDKEVVASSSQDDKEKKHTNAFQVMMDSRNKSIGSNSPGKEKIVDPTELEEIMEKKSVKVKRNLALQKMAEAKGALKSKEMEEYQEKNIKKKMEQRKERLKVLLVNGKPKNKKKDEGIEKAELHKNKVTPEVDEVVEITDSDKNNLKNKNDNDTPKTLQLVDIFKDVLKPSKIVTPVKKIVPKEDVEFLKKLSPSIKKKENMLCYFKKIERKSDGSPEEKDSTNESSPVIKVKMLHKNKKKLKKMKKLSLNKVPVTDVLKENNENEGCNDNKNENQVSDGVISQDSSCERKKRKRKENSTFVKIENSETIQPIQSEKLDEGRPKRSVKRPVKYSEDVQLSSSDEELHIFTPKKRKQNENKSRNLEKEAAKEIIVSDDESKKTTKKSKIEKKIEEKDNKTQKKATKLAPIFKPKLDPEQLEAKQKFLYSGVPDQIKKIMAQQKNLNIEVSNDFPVVVHVQQVEIVSDISNEAQKLLDYSSEEDEVPDSKQHLLNKLISTATIDNIQTSIPSFKGNVTTTLQHIKYLHPKFPVFRTYRLLKNRTNCDFKEATSQVLENSIEVMNGVTDETSVNPDYLNWTDKYKAISTRHLIGNFESIKELKKWLLSWTENEAKTKNTAKNGSDSSDFYDSDSNSTDCLKAMNNLLVLTGPVGCGKTSSIYAVAADLAMKVIEVNASSKRTGKVMLQDLQEATQSHKVNRGGLESSQKSQEVVEVPEVKLVKRTLKRGRPKKAEVPLKKTASKDEMLSSPNASQESARTGMSLILVDDADIVFDQDDGFSSAIAQLTQISKRPVILVTASLSCPHLQRFVQCGKIIYMSPLSPRISGTWLDVMCLADNGISWPGLGAKILDYYKGDIRKSINCLQFHVSAHSQGTSNEEEGTSQTNDYKSSTDDENSNISWAENENSEERNVMLNPVKEEVWKCFMAKQTSLLHLRYPFELVNAWWSVPDILKTASFGTIQMETESKESKLKRVSELEKLANVTDAFSVSDVYSSSMPDTCCNIISDPWYSTGSDSVSELENLASYNRSDIVTEDILQELITGSLVEAQKFLKCKVNTTVDFPNMAAQREKDRITARHDNLSNLLSPSSILDRRALALDYWSGCRTICKIEKNKNDNVSKRNNRFYHYLKSMNALGRHEAFDILADTLCFKGQPTILKVSNEIRNSFHHDLWLWNEPTLVKAGVSAKKEQNGIKDEFGFYAVFQHGEALHIFSLYNKEFVLHI